MPVSGPAPNAVVVYANYFQFSRAERISFPRVSSRMILWCKSGNGEVAVNGEVQPLGPDDLLFLPWAHAIKYRADAREPFFVGGIHIIPRHARSRKVVFRVAHFAGAALANRSWRKDVPIRGLFGLIRGTLAHSPCLPHLVEYVVGRFQREEPEEWEARGLARLLLAELRNLVRGGGVADGKIPAELRRMLQFVRNHRTHKLSLQDLADFSQKSPSGVGRLFRRHLHVTPVQWITNAKMENARQLLATSHLPVGEIGRRVGIDDPFYFSKLFKKTTGISPLACRRRSSLL